MNPNEPSFKKLQKKWYDKLKKEGFKDIEQSDGNLKEWASSRLLTPGHMPSRTLWNDSVEQYFRLAGFFLNDYEFKSELEKYIWSLHCDGRSIKDIVKVITSKKKREQNKLVRSYKKAYAKSRFTVNINNVFKIINALADIMKQENGVNGK